MRTLHLQGLLQLPKKASTVTQSSETRRGTARSPIVPRLSPDEREKQILEGAIAFFSEVGFSGQTRELSRRLKITQPLLYRYFPSKQILIERVFEKIFLGRWDAKWVELIRNEKMPLRDRLIEFYRQYAAATYQPEWIRLYMYAGLADTGINKRYLELVEREFLSTLCLALRRYSGLKRSAAVSQEEIEFAWSLHGGIFYYAVRHFVFGVKSNVDFMANVALIVDNFLAGVAVTYPTLLRKAPGKKTARSRQASRQI
jgi:AcrR family transcriptional regulator